MQTGFSNINTRVYDLTTKLEALRLRASMNQERREAHNGDDIRSQLVFEPVHANPRGQYDYEYSFDKKDLFWLMGDTYKNCKEKRNMFKDLSRADFTLDLFLKFHLYNHLFI